MSPGGFGLCYRQAHWGKPFSQTAVSTTCCTSGGTNATACAKTKQHSARRGGCRLERLQAHVLLSEWGGVGGADGVASCMGGKVHETSLPARANNRCVRWCLVVPDPVPLTPPRVTSPKTHRQENPPQNMFSVGIPAYPSCSLPNISRRFTIRASNASPVGNKPDVFSPSNIGMR